MICLKREHDVSPLPFICFRLGQKNYQRLKVAKHRMSILKQCKASLQYFLLAVCAAVLLKQKLGILNPQGLQWEGKASGTIPVVEACCEIQRSVNPEPPEGWRLGPVCYSGPAARRRKRRWCRGGGGGERKRQGERWNKDATTEKRERQPRSAGEKKHHNSRTWKTGFSIAVFMELSYKASRTHGWVSAFAWGLHSYTHLSLTVLLDRSVCVHTCGYS